MLWKTINIKQPTQTLKVQLCAACLNPMFHYSLAEGTQ